MRIVGMVMKDGIRDEIQLWPRTFKIFLIENISPVIVPFKSFILYFLAKKLVNRIFPVH
uniref:Uncharacterized protein n=1 Tax=Lepeophtheirus salmonis TaxID=72036 RepID=A0A0K2TAH9_LEPSM